MSTQNLRETGNQVKAALDRITQAKNDPAQVQQAVTEAKSKIDQMIQQSDQGSPSQQQR